MAIRSFEIDPDAKLDYGLDWSAWLNSGDALSSSSWAIDPSGPTLTGQSISGDATTVTVEGCTEGERYRLTNSIVTSDGLEDDRTIVLECEQQ